jgi:predicted ATPase/class 3 adenylate cyclase
MRTETTSTGPRGAILPVEWAGAEATVTFLFTDIEGSTELWERHPAVMTAALARHDAIVRAAIERHGGQVFKALGDAFCAVFFSAPDAVTAAVDAQRALLAEPWDLDAPIKVRMAIHSGTAEHRGDDWFGPPLNRVARMLDAAHGGQILLSQAVEGLVADRFPEGTALRDLGARTLKDLARPERIFQLAAEDLPSEFPPLLTLDARPHNLPVSPTPLVGREAEIVALRTLVLREGARLVTLIGPGGTGKTRLALQLAAELVDAFRDGVFLVNFAPVQDPSLVPAQILQALGEKVEGDLATYEALRETLRDRQILLVLDNFEQLVVSAPLVGSLLRESAGVVFLVTSQAALRIQGEREFPVPPLDVPGPDAPADPARLLNCDAVVLFVQRARASLPSFDLTIQNAAAVAEIVRQLDGLPLAIELAAARVKMFPPEALLPRLARGYDFLTSGARDLPDRHRTLRAAIQWSYDLLDDDEKALFRRQAVFDGGFTLEAAEAIVSAPGAELDVVTGLGSLLDKSLLRQVRTSGAEPRFERLRTIRAFAVEKLEECGEAEFWRRRHAEWFADFAGQFSRDGGPATERREKLEHLAQELDNLRAAFHWAIESGEAAVAVRLCAVLPAMWFLRGVTEEGGRLLEQVLALGDALSTRDRATILSMRGRLRQVQGDNSPRVIRDFEESLALFQELADEAGIARATMSLGNVHRRRGDYGRAEELFRESLATYRRLGDKVNEGGALLNLGDLYTARGDSALARSTLEEVAALARRSRNQIGLGYALGYLGSVAYQEGELDEAERHLEESLEIFRSVGGGEISQAWMLGGLASIERERGRLDPARDLFGQALAIFRDRDYRPGIAYVLVGYASLRALANDPERAARLLGAADAIAREAYIARTPTEEAARAIVEERARSALGEKAFGALCARGAELSTSEALALAEDGAAAGSP